MTIPPLPRLPSRLLPCSGHSRQAAGQGWGSFFAGRSMPGKSSDAATLIRRLQALDAALASLDGLHIQTAAQEHGVSAKTIQRDLALLRELGHPHMQERQSGDGRGNQGDRHVHRYSPSVPRMFGAARKSGQYGRSRVYDRDLMRQMAGAGYTGAEIAERLGCTRALVHQVCRSLLPGSRRSHSLRESYDRMRELAGKGWSARQIADEIPCSRQLVYRICRGQLRPQLQSRTIDRGAICQMGTSGTPARTIAALAGCSYSSVQRILADAGIASVPLPGGRPRVMQ